jgi:hypothetical protein
VFKIYYVIKKVFFIESLYSCSVLVVDNGSLVVANLIVCYYLFHKVNDHPY